MQSDNLLPLRRASNGGIHSHSFNLRLLPLLARAPLDR